jgi:hypothetical protein
MRAAAPAGRVCDRRNYLGHPNLRMLSRTTGNLCRGKHDTTDRG